ncbi:MAG: SDR family NAD(P)-dependent oxidoreductase [Actinomycetota bacterium]
MSTPALALDLHGHVALITGANHGIGAATARKLAGCGASVLLSYLRLEDEPDDAVPEANRQHRASDPGDVLEAIRAAGGDAHALEADLADEDTPTMLFDTAENLFGPVDILINNASGWVADTFKAVSTDRLGRSVQPVSKATIERVFAVDAHAAALLIAEFSRRHIARGACGAGSSG